MGDNDVVAHDPSVGVRRRHLPNFVGEEEPLEWRAPGKDYFQGSATFGQNGVLRLV